VLIEARIVEATRTFSQSLGIEWAFYSQSFRASSSTLAPLSLFSQTTGTTNINVPIADASIPIGIGFPASGTNPAAIA